eukprot:SAG31_NODE_32889_length_350_cov_1.175299_1_plen_37_part_01
MQPSLLLPAACHLSCQQQAAARCWDAASSTRDGAVAA